ncbi:MAG: hypothetical protein JNK78_00615 [Planctomycetes bacterium]|nr:hypothetical protein [Planctomycetota bacterium]
MRVVLVSSPGDPALGHWSHAAAAECARLLGVAGASVEWFRVGGDATPAPPGVAVREMPFEAVPLHRVANANGDARLEAELTRALRAQPAFAIVHFGLGARGSPNVPWVAERMGSVPFAVVRATDVVCHRGTTIDAAGAPCFQFDDPERCRRCCASSWWTRPRAMAFTDRRDLLLGSLAVTAGVFVPNEHDAERLASFGAPRRTLVTTHDPRAIAARLLGNPVAV